MSLPRDLHRRLFAPTGAAIRPRTIAVATLGMAAPVLVGWATGFIDAGFTVGLGAVLLAGNPAAPATAGASGGDGAAAVVPALLAVVAATLVAGGGWTDPLTIALAAIAALVTGYSRPLAVAAIRFGIYLVVSVGLLDAAGPERNTAALIFGVGALWNIALRQLLHERTAPVPPATGRTPTPAQRRAHFRATLGTLAGWQFPLRLAGGLAVASVVRHHWPDRHYFWIMLTVALLTQRPVERLPVRTVERLAGTVLGVGATWLILAAAPSHAVLIALVCALAAAVPVARARTYLLYSAVSTPLILLVLDLGRPVATALLTDRLVATVVGGAIVVAGNLVVARLTARATPS